MVYSENDPNFAVLGKLKGAEAFLRERGLWPLNGWRSEGSDSNWSLQKIAEAVKQSWVIILDAVLGRFSHSNRTSGIRRTIAGGG